MKGRMALAATARCRPAARGQHPDGFRGAARPRWTAPLIALALAACGGDSGGGGTPPEPPRPATITVQPSSADLNYIGQTTGFTATVRDQFGNAMTQAVTWSSSDDAVFAVDAQGTVTATGNGSATVEAAVAALSATASVRVQQRAAAIRVVSGNGQEAERGTKLPEPVVVRLEDRGGHGVAGQDIAFAPGAESGSVSVESTTSDENGEGSTEWTLGSKFGAQTLVVSVPGGIQNRANATATSATPLPDLSLESLELSRNDPTDLETLVVTATIANNGDAASPNTFAVQLALCDETVSDEQCASVGMVVDSAMVPGLQPEGRTTLSFAVGPFEAGSHRLALVADPERGIDEWEKGNNTRIENIAVAHQQAISVEHSSNISATLDQVLLFRIDVEEGSKEALNVEVAAANNQDPDLFVNYGFRPEDRHDYSCISGEAPGDRELCQLLPTRVGSYHVAVHAYSSFGPLELKVSVGGIAYDPFDIELIFVQNGTAEQDNVIRGAASTWESAIVRDVADFNGYVNEPLAAGSCGAGSPAIARPIDDVLMFVSIDSIDGPGTGNANVLARAGPCSARLTRFTGHPDIPGPVIVGAMEFDEFDLGRLAAQGTLVSTVTHEMGHVLGFGTVWNRFELLEDPSVGGGINADPHFTGLLARAAFDRSGGRSYRGPVVPVEGGGVLGRSDSHWRESVMENELMTPFLSAGVEPFSVITIEAMADLGYNVDPTVADSYRVSGAGAAVAGDREAMVDLRGDIADYPIVFYDQKGKLVRTVRRR